MTAKRIVVSFASDLAIAFLLLGGQFAATRFLLGLEDGRVEAYFNLPEAERERIWDQLYAEAIEAVEELA